MWVDLLGLWKGDMHKMFWKGFWFISIDTYERYIIDDHNTQSQEKGIR